MRKFLINLLFKLSDRGETFSGIDDERIGLWLETLTADKGFRDYTRKRTLQLLKSFGMLVDRDNYAILVGQRMELLRLMNEAEKAQKRAEAKKKGRASEKK